VIRNIPSQNCPPDETADHVILAAPFSALTHVRFGHNGYHLSGFTRSGNLHYENATKIVLDSQGGFGKR